MQRELTQGYINDLRAHQRKAERSAATQALRGLAPIPSKVTLPRDYYQEQMNIRLNNYDIDIFDPNVEGNNISKIEL
jgi:hypothetical protein